MTRSDRHPPTRMPEAVRTLVELAPVGLFFAGYILLRETTVTIGAVHYDGIIIVTAAFVPVLLVCTGVLWKLTGALSPVQVFTALMVILFGGLTVWLNDERFIKVKPTIINLLFAGILGWGLLRGRSYIRLLMDRSVPMTAGNWMRLTRRMTVLFLVLALVNEAVWRTLSTDVWVLYRTFVQPALSFLFIGGQVFVLMEKGEEGDDGSGGGIMDDRSG